MKEYKKYIGKSFMEFLKTSASEEVKNKNILLLKSIRLELIKFKLVALLYFVLIYFISSAFVLFICPQFHLHYFSNFQGILYFIAPFGEAISQFVSGVIMVLVGMVLASLILPLAYKKYFFSLRHVMVLFVISLLLFVFSFFTDLSCDICMIMWVVGAFTGGLLAIRVLRHSMRRVK